MLGLRHEEYTVFDGDLPFKLFGVKRTPTSLSGEYNWHENLELQFFTGGCGSVVADGKSYAVESGDIAVIGSDEIHYTHTDTEIEYYCLIVGTELLNEIGVDYSAFKFRTKIKDGGLFDKFCGLNKLCQADIPFKRAKLYVAVIEILTYLCENYARDKGVRGVNERAYETAKTAIGFIRENYGSKITLDMLAKAAYTDKFSLSRDFKRATGKTAVEFINEYRILKAAECIMSGLNVSEAARLCGFDNMSYFTATFKKLRGETPSQVKKRADLRNFPAYLI